MKRQKTVLDRAMALNPDIREPNDLPKEVYAELERINDTEILYQEINRYISDTRWARIGRL